MGTTRHRSLLAYAALLTVGSSSIESSYFASPCPVTFFNRDVVRTVNATDNLVRSVVRYSVVEEPRAAGGCEERVRLYYISLGSDEAAHLVSLHAAYDVEGSAVALPVQRRLNYDSFAADSRPPGVVMFSVTLPPATGAMLLVVSAVLKDMQRPLPARIAQRDAQRVVLTMNPYVLSPYPTERQRTYVELASSDVVSFDKTPLPVSLANGSVLVFGEYPDILPYTEG